MIEDFIKQSRNDLKINTTDYDNLLLFIEYIDKMNTIKNVQELYINNLKIDMIDLIYGGNFIKRLYEIYSKSQIDIQLLNMIQQEYSFFNFHNTAIYRQKKQELFEKNRQSLINKENIIILLIYLIVFLFFIYMLLF